MADSECRAEFGVNKCNLARLAECLQISGASVCNQGSVCEGMEAICMLLRRLSYGIFIKTIVKQVSKKDGAK